MTEFKNSSRRAFFVSGGAVLGAGAAVAVGASSLKADVRVSADEQLNQLRQQLESIADREAIRNLHQAFTVSMERQAYESATELFDDQAHLQLSGASAAGKRDIARLLAHEYRDQDAAAIHNAYRHNTLSQQNDTITLSEDRLHATATFHVEVELCTPLRSDCTVAQMARLQGHVADRRWEAGRFEAKYVKTGGRWKMASLSYVAG